MPQSLHHFGQHEVPISVVVLFDKSSSSQDGDKIMHAKDAAVNFVRALEKREGLVEGLTGWSIGAASTLICCPICLTGLRGLTRGFHGPRLARL